MIQGGDPTGTGRGGMSIYGSSFEDEIVSLSRSLRSSPPGSGPFPTLIPLHPCSAPRASIHRRRNPRHGQLRTQHQRLAILRFARPNSPSRPKAHVSFAPRANAESKLLIFLSPVQHLRPCADRYASRPTAGLGCSGRRGPVSLALGMAEARADFPLVLYRPREDIRIRQSKVVEL